MCIVPYLRQKIDEKAYNFFYLLIQGYSFKLQYLQQVAVVVVWKDLGNLE